MMFSSSYGRPGRFVLLFALLAYVSALTDLDNTNLTACGRLCLDETVSNLGCELSSAACQCRLVVLQTTVDCLSATSSCTMEDSLQYYKVQASVCDLPSESRSKTMEAAAAVLMTFIIAFSMIRLGGKVATKRYGSDDVIISICFVLGISTFVLFIVSCRQGLGLHMWDIPDTFTLVRLLQQVFVIKFLTTFATPLVKVAIVLFYMSVFRSSRSKKVAWALIVFIVVCTIITTLSVLLRCKPVAYFWNKNIISGSCNTAFVNHGLSVGLSIAQDICLVTFPAFQIGKLQMKIRKKIFVIGMFALGGCGCILAIFHLTLVVQSPLKRDAPWDYSRLEMLAASEFVVCYMGACLPMIGACLSLVFPNRFGTSRSGTRSSRRWARTQAEQDTIGRPNPKGTSTIRATHSPSTSTLDGLELPMITPSDEWKHMMSSDTHPLAPAAAHLVYEKNGNT